MKHRRNNKNTASRYLNKNNQDQSGHTGEQISCKEKKIEEPILIQKFGLQPEEFLKQQTDNDIKRVTTIARLENRRLITWTSVIIMVFALIASYLLIALTGLQYMQLPDKLIYCLGGSTISSILSTGAIVFKYQVQS
jgi:hypothetical protein